MDTLYGLLTKVCSSMAVFTQLCVRKGTEGAESKTARLSGQLHIYLPLSRKSSLGFLWENHIAALFSPCGANLTLSLRDDDRTRLCQLQHHSLS